MKTKRTDEQILDELLAVLINNSRFDASGIEVSVKDGEIFLHGFVDSWESRRSANDIADNIPGVSAVHSHLEIRPPKVPE